MLVGWLLYVKILAQRHIGEFISGLSIRMDLQASLCMTNPGILIPVIVGTPHFTNKAEHNRPLSHLDIGLILPNGPLPMGGSAYLPWSPGGHSPPGRDSMNLLQWAHWTGRPPCSSSIHRRHWLRLLR